MENKVMFFHTKPEKGKRRCTFAGIINGQSIRVGIASCSLKDHFIKKLGRTIAEGRARKSPEYLIAFTEYPIQIFIQFCKDYPRSKK
jgi:hypothetical protein